MDVSALLIDLGGRVREHVYGAVDGLDADALVVHGIRAEEIINGTRLQLHTLTSFAKVDGTVITYPPQAPPP